MLSAFPNDYDPLAGLRDPSAAEIQRQQEWQRLLNTPPAPETDQQKLARLIEERAAQNHRVWEEQQKMRVNKEEILHLRTKIAAAAEPPPVETPMWVAWNGQRQPRFYELLAELRALHDAKAHDYAPGEDRFLNFRQCEALGVPAYEGAVIRMTDKMSRLTNLIKRGKGGDGAAVADESLVDTLRDLACYSLITIELYEQHRG